MTFKEWAGKYYPNETQETLHKMSHAWASAHVNMIFSEKKQTNAIDIVGQELRFHVENKGMTDKGESYEDGFINALVHIHALLIAIS